MGDALLLLAARMLRETLITRLRPILSIII